MEANVDAYLKLFPSIHVISPIIHPKKYNPKHSNKYLPLNLAISSPKYALSWHTNS
jgi:hypothetical protein